MARPLIRGTLAFVALMAIPIATCVIVERVGRAPTEVASAARSARTAAPGGPGAAEPAPTAALPTLRPRVPRPSATSAPVVSAAPSHPAPASSSAGAAIHGRVLDPSGQPVEGARVTCRTAAGPPPPAETDDHGLFAFEDGVAACTLVAFLAPHAQSAPVEARAGELVELRLRGGATISGHASLAGGGPVAAYDLWVSCVEPPCRIEPIQHFESPEGAFELLDLPPGGYRLVVRAPGRRPSEPVVVTVEEGARLEGVGLVVPAGAP